MSLVIYNELHGAPLAHPPAKYVHVLPPELVNVTLFGKKWFLQMLLNEGLWD